MNPAALARYTNPGAELGHAGPSAPVHADPRLDFAADLPRLADSPQAAADGFRANLLQKDAEQLARTNRLLREALRAVLDEIDGPQRPYSTDSYLPEHIVEQARRALILGGLL